MDRIRRIRKVWLFVGGLIAGLLIGVLVKVMMHHNPGLPIQTSKIVSEKICNLNQYIQLLNCDQ